MKSRRSPREGRGALDELALCLDTFRSLFEQALTLTGVDNVHWRARSIHLSLLGTLNQKLVAPVPRDEVAFALSALAGFALDPERWTRDRIFRTSRQQTRRNP